MKSNLGIRWFRSLKKWNLFHIFFTFHNLKLWGKRQGGEEYLFELPAKAWLLSATEGDQKITEHLGWVNALALPGLGCQTREVLSFVLTRDLSKSLPGTGQKRRGYRNHAGALCLGIYVHIGNLFKWHSWVVEFICISIQGWEEEEEEAVSAPGPFPFWRLCRGGMHLCPWRYGRGTWKCSVTRSGNVPMASSLQSFHIHSKY